MIFDDNSFSYSFLEMVEYLILKAEVLYLEGMFHGFMRGCVKVNSNDTYS